MLRRVILFLIILPLFENSLYLYNTDDSLSVEFYDCITDINLPYCRRPSQPIALQRDQSIWYCYYEGISHSFTSLIQKNISVSTVLHEWKSSIEKAEEYSRYKKQHEFNKTADGNETYLCQCIHPQTFGKHCEYLLPMGNTFNETINWEVVMRKNNGEDVQMYSDIVCYTTLICDSGLLCLDWRDICDGIQHCMFGYDEENCDKLEFNECEDDEYRCANGMCIPDLYFLDGEYDCLDLTDEKQLFNDTGCTFQQPTYECDDRMCFRYEWSCGDGQCIGNRLAFLTSAYVLQCNSLRDQYYMCELHYKFSQWTLPNGKCRPNLNDYVEILAHNRSGEEKCIYFMKCALSFGAEKNCPCKRDLFCLNQLKNPCNSSTVRYPNGTIFTPYTYHLYKTNRDWSRFTPDFIEINGSIKCRGYMASKHTLLNYLPTFKSNALEAFLCALKLDNTVLTNLGYDEFCHNNSRTFNNRSYHFVDICEWSKECISVYRIADGYHNCLSFVDEQRPVLFPNACTNVQHHRFRCSDKEPTCFLVTTLGDQVFSCHNKRDEWWMEGETILSKLVCNAESKNDCGFLRQYLEASTRIDTNNSSDQQLKLPIIPFRTFCDTFWNWASKKDEEITMCRRWWICLEHQWQCRSGQCIERGWILDGEWDCVDASDEQGLLMFINNISDHNLNITEKEELMDKFHTLYSNQSFWTLCNLSMEYPCFLADVSDPLNITKNRPCINVQQIGDGHIDCEGGLDERNTLKQCVYSTMLGYTFQCSSAELCIPYSSHCPDQCVNNNVQCYGYKQTINCSKASDFTCLDGQCVKGGWCNQQFDCSYGEDELLCLNRTGAAYISPYRLYRDQKELYVRTTKQILQLPQLPTSIDEKNATDEAISTSHSKSTSISTSYKIISTISYECNRGIGIQLYNGSIACFCPPQYYGDRCQFHIDRVTVLFHLNLSQSIYAQSNNMKTILQVLIIFLNEGRPLMTESFHIRVADTITVPKKKLVHLFYSRSNTSLKQKRARYLNRPNIIHKHPYSVRIEAYELNPHKKAQIVAVWLYPIYFDFLPSFRLAKVLHLTKPDVTKNPCFSNPCNSRQECHQVLNQNFTYVCLCSPNFKGENCLIIDDMCKGGFCSTNALCKPNYRGILSRNEQPYCICPYNQLGDRCDLIHDKCDSNPCQNDGTCLSTSKPNQFICLCHHHFYGDKCQLEKRSIRLSINEKPNHRAAVVQYFNINFFSLDLLLVHQRVYDKNLPGLLHDLHDQNTAPEIIVVKLYSDTEPDVYLISVQINVESINGTTDINEKNRCIHIDISPFRYHNLCIQNQSLLCFVDDSYLCICDENHIRSECFTYNHKLDQCSDCLNGGRCLKEDQFRSDFLCLCPRCHTGKFCQFNSEYFSFTVDQLFSTNLGSKRTTEKQRTIFLIIFGSWLFFLLGLFNNTCSFVTFRRTKCLQIGIGHYLLCMSIVNQINLTFLALRLTHLTLNATNFRSNPLVDKVLCKILNYILISSGRILYWFVSLIAIERVYTTLFLRGQWLKKPYIAKHLIILVFLIILLTGSYELYFVQSYNDLNNENDAVCTLSFPRDQKLWANIHKIATVIHTLVPFFINICCTMIISCIIIRKKFNINKRVINSRPTNTQQQQIPIEETQNNDGEMNPTPLTKEKNCFSLLRDVLIENKELIIGPGVTLIPQLFSLPLFIVSVAFACQEIEKSSLRYLLITSYITSFIPQLISFFLYISPSSFYTREWHSTNIGIWFQRFKQCRRQNSSTAATISFPPKDFTQLEITKSKQT